MKTIIFVVCLLVGNSFAAPKFEVHSSSKRDEEKMEIPIIENVINSIIATFEKLDPIIIHEQSFDAMGYTALLKNIQIEGFSNITADVLLDISFLTTTFKFDLTIPKISASIESWESNFEIFNGKGTAGISFSDSKISVSIPYHLTNGFKPSTTVISSNVNTTLTGFRDNEELSEAIAKYFENKLNSYINDPLLDVQFGELVDRLVKALFGLNKA